MQKVAAFLKRCVLAFRALGVPSLLRALLYAWQRDRLDRGSDSDPGPGAFQKPGAVRNAARIERGVLFTLEAGAVELLVLAPDLVRVTWEPGPPPAAAAPLLAPGDWPATDFELEEQPALWRLRSSALDVRIQKQDAGISFRDAAGRVLRQESAPLRSGARSRLGVRLAPEEHIFGLGERAALADRRGGSWRFWNLDPAGTYALGDDPLYLSIPVCLSLHAQGAVLVFFENSHPAVFDLGASQREVAEHRFEGGPLRYHVMTGSPSRCLDLYTELTGRAPLPPLWALGYHQSRYSYYPEQRVRELAADFERHDLPLDVIHLDIHYMDAYRVFTWDRERFPDPARLAADLQAKGIRLVTIVDPGVLRDPGWALFQDGLERDVYCKRPDEEVLYAPVWPGWCAFPDFTDPRARAWWGERYRALLEAGISGFWNDMNEPAAFAAWGEPTLPLSTRHALEGRGGDHREGHNLYGLGMTRAGHEGLLRLAPGKRPFIVSRSGWAGLQRYAWSWTGDCNSDWPTLRLVVPMVLGLGLSGIPFTGPDVGGFSGTPSAELYTRWFQLGAFLPFFRSHTVIGSPDQEPWSYGEPHLGIHRDVLRMRYSLLPYLYTAAWQASRQGAPMVRPLFWPSGTDARLWDVDDAFFLGDSLLVAPVLEPEVRQREVELPAGIWYELETGAPFQGPGRPTLDAPLEIIPVLVRAGSVLPRTLSASSTSRMRQDKLFLHLYPPSDGAQVLSWLYTDAGEGHEYREGAFRLERFGLRREGAGLRLEWTWEGAYPWPYAQIEIRVHGRAPLQGVTIDGIDVDFDGQGCQVAAPFRQAWLGLG